MSFDTHGDIDEFAAFQEGWTDIVPLPVSETCQECAYEAWERMTDAGMRIEIIPAREHSPWGIRRFQEPMSLMLVSWDDTL